MNRFWQTLLLAALSMQAAVNPARGQDDFAVSLPDGVKAVWDIDKAYHETTPTRERICLNGLWRWQPAVPSAEQVPTGRWGYFKVPGCWPGITDYMQKDSQTVHAHPGWKDTRPGSIAAAWYERTLAVPKEWQGRRMVLSAHYLNSYAAVFVDGTKRGEIRFPGGELELTAHLRPGDTHVLSLLVVAMPLKSVLLSYTDSNLAREMKGKVERRGLCGDVFLASTPAGPRLAGVKVDTSVQKSEITFEVALESLSADDGYALRGRICKETRALSTLRPFSVRPA